MAVAFGRESGRILSLDRVEDSGFDATILHEGAPTAFDAERAGAQLVDVGGRIATVVAGIRRVQHLIELTELRHRTGKSAVHAVGAEHVDGYRTAVVERLIDRKVHGERAAAAVRALRLCKIQV